MSELPSFPPPAPDLTTAWFWRAGAGGQLVLRRCEPAGHFLHPSLAVCPTHPGSSLVETPTSGRAVVVGRSTVPVADADGAPYVVAVVSLEDEPAVRFTTNVIGCAPDEVQVGMSVEVAFDEVGDAFVPRFRPGPAVDVAQPAPPDLSPPPRYPGPKFEDASVITGIGVSAVGRRLLVPPVALAAEAARQAIDDAGLELADIDGICTYPGTGGPGGMSEGGVTPIAEALGLEPIWHNGGMDQPGQGGALINAMLAVAGGLCRHVLCVRTVWEASYSHLLRSGAIRPPRREAAGEMQWRLPFGASSPATWIALQASQYMNQFGLERETLGRIALNARANAMRNPIAVYRDPLTMDDYLSARMISSPFGLYDCDVPCDGSVAIIVSAAETAGDRRHPAVRIEAVGTWMGERSSWDQGTMTHEPNVFGPARHLWTRTDLRPGDVDAAELYDGFTFNCLSWLEGLGFCGVGEAADFIGDGSTIALDGALPLNTHGGQLSAGRLHGFGFLHEAVVQLRGHGGERQVAGAEVVAVSTGGGTPSGCFLLTA